MQPKNIDVKSKSFLEGIKGKIGILAKGRKILKKDGELQLREDMGSYNSVFDGKKEDTGPLNDYFLDVIC